MTWRPKRGFRVGAMRERINVQSYTADDSTGERSYTWSNDFTDEPARFEPMAGQEVVRGNAVEAGISAVFTVRYRSGYSVEQRVVHGSDTYGIVHVKQVEGGLRYIELHCKTIPA